MQPNGHVPVTAGERLSIASELVQEALTAGLDPDRLILDPVLAPLIWANGGDHAQAVLETIRLLSQVLAAPVRTIVGLSNLTAGRGHLDARRRMEALCLAKQSGTGLDMVLLNVFYPEALDALHQMHVFRPGGIFTWEVLAGST